MKKMALLQKCDDANKVDTSNLLRHLARDRFKENGSRFGFQSTESVQYRILDCDHDGGSRSRILIIIYHEPLARELLNRTLV